MHRLTESILCKSSSIKKLLHSNLELSIPVTRVTRHSPSLDLLIWVRDLDFSGSREVTGHVIILTFKELRWCDCCRSMVYHWCQLSVRVQKFRLLLTKLHDQLHEQVNLHQERFGFYQRRFSLRYILLALRTMGYMTYWHLHCCHHGISIRREFSALRVQYRTWRALHCQSLKHKLSDHWDSHTVLTSICHVNLG